MCDEKIRHPHTVKNSGSGNAVSLQPRGDMVMRESHSLLAIYASGERDSDHDKPPKNQHVVIFQITETN